MTPSFLKPVDAIYVINLPTRADRRAEMDEQLAKIGLSLETPPVVLFDAVRPDDAGGFPSLGARGCFMSHLGVLQDAAAKNFSQILILEDDANLTPAFARAGDDVAAFLAAEPWGLVYFGHSLQGPVAALDGRRDDFVQVPADTGIMTSHATLIKAPHIAAIAQYFAAMLTRPGGDPAGGPMHVDGAYNWYRRAHADVPALATREQWAVQRASRTDVGTGSWKDRLPFASALRRLRNKLS